MMSLKKRNRVNRKVLKVKEEKDLKGSLRLLMEMNFMNLFLTLV